MSIPATGFDIGYGGVVLTDVLHVILSFGITTGCSYWGFFCIALHFIYINGVPEYWYHCLILVLVSGISVAVITNI